MLRLRHRTNEKPPREQAFLTMLIPWSDIAVSRNQLQSAHAPQSCVD